ncbi:MAG: transglutaminase domain-containing protein [Xanthomonadales bacterium]|nr:transglutaminase domain-containing protein [Xanthomonadales bacterium]
MKKIFWILSYAALFSMVIQPMAHAKDSAELIANVVNMKAINSKVMAPASKEKKRIVQEKNPEQLLSELSQEIYWDLYDWKEKNIKSFSENHKSKITAWQTRLTDLHQQVMVEMDKLTEWINKKNLSQVIKQRQQDAIVHINTEVMGLKHQLNQMLQNTLESSTEEAVIRSISNGFNFFEGKQLKRKHQVFDGLSSVALTPDRIPAAKTTDEFSKYGLTSHSKSNPASTKNFTDPAFLSTSDEVVINEKKKKKAAELENDPVEIYHWVRNNIEWLPSYGAVQASDITLGSGRGNAFDQSSLLLALLRTSGVPSRYVYGTIEVEIDKFTNWVGLNNPEAAIIFAQYGGIPIASVIEGGIITKVQMEHIWVEAAIDFMPSRGAVNITPDSWVTLDPSFKQYESLTGLDPIAISGQDMEQVAQNFIDSGTSNETEGWVQGFDQSILTNAQEQMQQSLTAHIEDNMTDPTVGDVIGGRRTIKQEFPVLPSSTMNRIVVKAADFVEMPDNMRPKYRLAFEKGITGQIVDPLELNFAQLNNHKLTLSFKPATPADEDALQALIPEGASSVDDIPTSIPAHLVKVIPQVALDEVVIKQGSPMNLGYDLTLYYQVHLPTQGTLNKQYSLPAGSYVNLLFGSNSISSEIIKELKSKRSVTLNNLNSGDNSVISQIRREKIFGDIYFAGALGYLSEKIIFSSMMAKQFNTAYNMSPVFGTFGFEPNVSYLFSIPRSIDTGGVSVNIYTTKQIESGNLVKNKQFNQISGTITSYLEHSIPEQQFRRLNGPQNAVSTMKLLSIGLQANQKIHTLSEDVVDDFLLNVSMHQDTKDEIKTAVLAGFQVLIHSEELIIDNWQGFGYVITDNATGNAAFKISGGLNGGQMDDPFDGASIALAGIQDTTDEATVTLILLVLDVISVLYGNAYLDFIVSLLAMMSILSTLEDGCPDAITLAYFLIIFAAILLFIIAFTAQTALLFGNLAGFIAGMLMSALLDDLVSYVANNCVEQTTHFIKGG